jgi:hypothetical protein
VSPRTACAIPLSFFCFATSALADPVDLAARMIGRPYAWGAEGPREFDCSGLTQYVYREYGIELPRRAISQSEVGDRVRQLRRGDLVFFSTEAGGSVVTHVGIYEGAGVMIDASKRHGQVRRDSLDDEYWVDRFMFARRLSSDAAASIETPRRPPQSPSPRSDRRKAAARVLEQIADVLLRRPRR